MIPFMRRSSVKTTPSYASSVRKSFIVMGKETLAGSTGSRFGMARCAVIKAGMSARMPSRLGCIMWMWGHGYLKSCYVLGVKC